MTGTPTGSGAAQRPGRPARTVLRDLMTVDARLRAVTVELSGLRDPGEIRRLEQAVAEERRAKVAADQAAGDDQARVRRMRQDAAKLRARRRDDVKGLGAAVDVEKRRDLAHDLAVAERRLAEVEAAIEAAERPTRADAGTDRERALDEAVRALDEARRRQRAGERELSGQRDSLAEHSATLRAELPPPLLRRYERGEQENGVGAATLTGSACRACFMSLDRSSLAEILSAPPDLPATCPECGTMLLPDVESYTDFVDRGRPAG
ncbi:zinc ribbon domain-containing protein [Corynebacterium sp.]|uniref:zinc ribbon domain-containing protein n=1 Tax=Corynebacterium sp. TaxID=1720 RepID=UPI003B3AD6FE